MTRKLATIQTIKALTPIVGADMIELATFADIGWQCVVKKGEFQVGDLCVYFEIDSLLPLRPEFEFLARGNNPKKTLLDNGKVVEGFRLKTIKLRGQLSQGLALPLAVAFGDKKSEIDISNLELGVDVSEILGVYKYEPPISPQLEGLVKGNFPSFIPKTDEIRIQTCWEIMQKYLDREWCASIKYDGASCTMYRYENNFGVCSRNLELLETDQNAMWQIANKYELKDKLPEGFAIQGEIYGEGIQSNPHKVKGVNYKIFNVYDIANAKYLSLEKMSEFVAKIDLELVEIFDYGQKDLQNMTADKLLEIADKCGLEGLVFRPREELRDPEFGRVSFKVISNKYLLKEE